MAGENKRSAQELNNSISSTPLKPKKKQSKLEDVSDISMNDLYQLMLKMSKKMEKLDSIEQHLARVDEDIYELKKSCQYVHDCVEELEQNDKKNKDMFKQITDKVSKLEEENKKISEAVVDLRARLMRNNLIFYSIDESKDNEEDNCMEKVQDVIEKVGVEMYRVNIEQAYRIGKRNSKPGPRPIVARFLRYQDKEEIRKSAYKLKGSKIGISEQFPKEIEEKRKLLYPILKECKKAGKKARLVRDQLYIEGQRYTGPGTWR